MRKATNRELFRLRLGKSGNNASLRGIFEIFPLIFDDDSKADQ
jgi:hypothetical protein